jgi:hypothetical protein
MRVPYYVVICGLSDFTSVVHYLKKGTIFGKKDIVKNIIFISPTTSVWNISHSKKNSASYCYLCVCVFV